VEQHARAAAVEQRRSRVGHGAGSASTRAFLANTTRAAVRRAVNPAL
jgi:hypothetical protein